MEETADLKEILAAIQVNTPRKATEKGNSSHILTKGIALACAISYRNRIQAIRTDRFLIPVWMADQDIIAGYQTLLEDIGLLKGYDLAA